MKTDKALTPKDALLREASRLLWSVGGINAADYLQKCHQLSEQIDEVLSAQSEKQVSDYHPNLDGPAEPVGLAMDDGTRSAEQAPGRRQGHSALRVQDGRLVVFDPHPPADVQQAAKEWAERVNALPVIPPSAYEGFLSGVAWARSVPWR